MEHFGRATVLFLIQLLNFALIFGFVFITQIGILMPPIGIIFGVLCYIILGEVEIVLYEKFPYVKRKTFLLCYFLPIFLILIVLGAIMMLLAIIKSEALNATFGSGYIFYLVVFFALYLVNFINFMVTTLRSIKRCKQCGECGFGLFKVTKTKVLKTWEEKNGSKDCYRSVTLTDNSGNTYSGSVCTGSAPVFDKYEQRERIAQCKSCNKTYSTVKDFRIGLMRKIIDKMTQDKD